jgi:hypothetical protein
MSSSRSPTRTIKNLLKLEESFPISMNSEDPEENRTEWRLANGTLHREFGPAITYENGNFKWFYHGEIHREDGPAISEVDKVSGEINLYYYLDGKCLREVEYERVTNASPDQQIVIESYVEHPEPFLFRQHRLFDESRSFDDKKWHWTWIFKNKRLHNTDGPAVKNIQGEFEYRINGILHREDGPAKRDYYQIEYYYVHGKNLAEDSFNKWILEIMKKSSHGS